MKRGTAVRYAVAAVEAETVIRDLAKALQSLRTEHHYECEDCWYSCPKAENYCNDERATECSCGMDQRNAAIEAALSLVPKEFLP